MRNSENSGSPLFSSLSIILASGALIILVTVFLFQGSVIFSPGSLSAQNTRGLVLASASSHAEIEQQCKYCHQPLVSSQSESCLKCHDDIASQIDLQSGLHGILSGVNSCRSCHMDHKGRDFDMLQDAIQKFDHNLTAFPLTGEHLPLDCQDCHTANEFQISSACSDCHAEPEQHAEMFSSDCTDCHSTQAWVPAVWKGNPFDHEAVGFSLILHDFDYQGISITCLRCHQKETAEVDVATCKNCHEQHDFEYMQSHSGEFGMDCTACHDGLDRMHNFNHQNVYVLDGAHSELDCVTCHENQVFIGLPNECSDCHSEPEIHAGSFGLNCVACHSTDAWQPAVLKEHTFPLDHGDEGEIACETCHTVTYTQYTCENCHDSRDPDFIEEHDEEKLSQDRLMDCVECHADGETHD